MNVDVTMPQLGETVTEGTVTKWLRAVGDLVAENEPLLEIATDKVDTEVPSPASGRLVRIVVDEDATVSVGTLLAVIGSEQAVAAEPAAAAPSPPAAPSLAGSSGTAEPSPATDAAHLPLVQTRRQRHQHSPLIRRLAREHGLALADLHGSGPAGRVTRNDVSAAATALALAETETTARPTPVPGRSPATVAHATSVVEVDVTAVLDSSGADPARDLLAPIAAAVVGGLRMVTALNAPVADGGGQHLAIRVDTTGGALSLVVRNAGDLSEDGLARRIAAGLDGAASGNDRTQDLADATFTISSNGAHGVLLESPIVHPGHSGALTIGAVTERPVVLRHGSERVIAIRSTLYLALSYDHTRVTSGAAAQFLAHVKDRLESATH